MGAIRWGGWFRDSEWAAHLDDPQWHNRLPFYAELDPSGTDVHLIGDRQEVMNQEIAYAIRAGLSYWAFCYYDERSEHDSYNYGLRLYLHAQHPAPPSFALILQGSHLGDPAEWPRFAERLMELFSDRRYQKVGDGRPLVFLFDIESLIGRFGSAYAVNGWIDGLRKRTESAGMSNPFIVAQNAPTSVPDLAFDAFSAYTAHGFSGERELPFSALMESNRKFWEAEWNRGRVVIPLLNLGWDPRPRMDHPVWDTAYVAQSWYAEASSEEISEHLRRGLEWVQTHASRDEERLLLLYAWNEFDEGGFVVPTLADGTRRIEAIRAGLVGG